MAIIKCKMCGGDLEISTDQSVATCIYCGSKQTLPRLSDERRANLYERASHFRRNNEYDKALAMYETILNEDGTDAEAYWSVVLCRYGIEYVEDPGTKRRIPTVNRTQHTSIFADEDYKSAVANATPEQRALYEAEAKTIDEIQKGILRISGKEEPYDVFISFKETDANGRRTPDAVLANDLYHQLTQEGFKVFFAPITLEDKLGTEYEPYIFAALNSAKVMVVLGTRPEYFNAVWVRNEWSRYLTLIKNGERKTLVPAYRDMSPYDLPEEFSHLMAQDMSKLGFMQDLIRGIKKLCKADEPKPQVVETAPVVAERAGNVQAFLDRGFLALEDGDWAQADDFFEQALNFDAKIPEAYLGKLMAELQVETRCGLRELDKPFDDMKNYKRTVRFAGDKLRVELEAHNDYIRARNEEKQLNAIYTRAVSMADSAQSIQDLKAASLLFAKIPGYKDADELKENCRQAAIKLAAAAEQARKQKIYDTAVQMVQSARTDEDFEAAALKFKEISGFLDADERAESCSLSAEEYLISLKEKTYEEACSWPSETVYQNEIAIKKFRTVQDWKDSSEKIKERQRMIDEIRAKEEAAREEAARHKKKKKGMAMIITVAVIILAIILAVIFGAIRKESIRKRAESFRETISAGNSHTVGIKSDGKVVSVGNNNNGQCKVSGWTDIVAISAGSNHTVGLRSNGTVVAMGSNSNGQCAVSDWDNIAAVSAGNDFTVGLRSDGTVTAVGNNSYGQCNVFDWTDIIAISAGNMHTVGLRSDGTVIATGNNDSGQCMVSGWSDIVAVSSGKMHTVGLCSDGTVRTAGLNTFDCCEVYRWTDIIAVSAGDTHTVGLRSNGTVVATGRNVEGQCEVSNWSNIVAVSAGRAHSVGLRSDGSVVAVGYGSSGRCDVSDWTDIKIPDNKS